MKITKIAPAVKTEGRYNVFVDEKFAFSLDESQLLVLELKKGAEISENQLAELKNESDFGKNYLRALDLISRRARSEKEVRDYAWRKQWTPENRDKVIARLREKGYLNDERFAESFVRAKATTANLSARKMRQNLVKKGIKADTIQKVLADNTEFDELAALRRLAVKKQGHYAGNKQKLMRYLAGQGFRFDDVKQVLAEANEEK
jgi:regulatory protein